MARSFYVAKSLKEATTFIEANTNWVRLTAYSFFNVKENETIIVVNDFDRIRGQRFEKVYIDYSFKDIAFNVKRDFLNRFSYMCIIPVEIRESVKADCSETTILTEDVFSALEDKFHIYAAESGMDRESCFDSRKEALLYLYICEQLNVNNWELED